MAWKARGYRVHVSAAITVHHGVQFTMGTARWLHGDRLLAEIDGAFEPQAPVEMRLDLSPLPGTALLFGRVHRKLFVADGEMGRWMFRITDVAASDLERFEAWIEQAEVGGTVSDIGAVSEWRRDDNGPHSTASERRVGLERVSARMSAPSAGQEAAGRSALRQAILTPFADTSSDVEETVDIPDPDPKRGG